VLVSRETSGQRSVRTLRLCFIAETVHAGVGRHVLDTITALSDRGHEIHLIYSPLRTDADFLAVIRRKPNVQCFAVTMPRAIGLADIGAFNTVADYVRANGPFDIIHGHSSKGGGYARLLKLLGHGPVVYSPHAFITMSPLLSSAKRALYRILEWTLARATDRVICTSAAERDHARALGLPASRLSFISNGNTPAAAPPREVVRRQLGIQDSQIAVGYAGRMEVQKAPERLIAAARQLFPDMPELVLVMIGSGPKLRELQDSIAGGGYEDRVRWLGALDARQYLPGFDIFVLPSLYEGCPYVLLEALSVGLPIVSTPVGGTHEAIEPGVNGFVVPHGNAQAMANAIRGLAADEKLRQAMSEASRGRAEFFTVPRMIKAMEAVYLELLSAKEAAPGELALPTPATRSS
jgi:glycosyltransferase involved in cell wall biosynthesis